MLLSMYKYIKQTNKFSSTKTGQTFPITSHINCKSEWIIYLITRTACNKQYIGKTETTLYTRFSNTRSEIINFNKTSAKQLPYTIHFNSPSHSIDNVTLIGIELIKEKSHTTILHRESFWIEKLKTLSPNGINVDK